MLAPIALLRSLRAIHYQRADAWQWDLWYKLQRGLLPVSAVAADFAQIAGLGVNCIRLSLHAGSPAQGSDAFTIGGSGPTAGQLASLTAVLSAARDAGLQVWINAFDHYSGWLLGDAITWTSAIVGAFPAGLRVAVWEYQNEVSSSMPNPAGFAAWIAALAPRARAILPAGTLTTISVTDTPGSGAEGCHDGTGRMRYLIATLLAGQTSLLDFAALHVYHYGRSEYWAELLAGNLAVCAPLPVFVGETGLSTNYMDAGFNDWPTNTPNNRLAREALDEYCWRAGAALMRSIGSGDPLRWCWADLPGIGDYGAAGSQIPPATIPAPTQAPGNSAFAAGDVVLVNYAWRNSYGSTTPQPASQQRVTIAVAGNTIILPPMAPPAQAIALDVYSSIANGSSTLTLAESQAVTSDQPLTRPLVLDAYGLVGAQAIPAAAPNTTYAPTSNVSNSGADQVYGREYGYGMLRTCDEAGGGLKPGALGMAAVWRSAAPVSTDSNLGFEAPAVPDFAGVMSWPPLWRRYIGNSHLISSTVSLAPGRPGSAGIQAVQIAGVSSDGTPSYFGIFQAPIQSILKPSNQLTIAGYVNIRALLPGMQVLVLLAWLDATNTEIAHARIYRSTAPTAGWTRFAGEASPPPGALACYIYLRLDPGAITTPGGLVLFDDLQFGVA